jgi:hypothetical protein
MEDQKELEFEEQHIYYCERRMLKELLGKLDRVIVNTDPPGRMNGNVGRWRSTLCMTLLMHKFVDDIEFACGALWTDWT